MERISIRIYGSRVKHEGEGRTVPQSNQAIKIHAKLTYNPTIMRNDV